MPGADLITDPGVLLVASLLAVGVVVAGMADRLRLPGLVVFLVVGMLLGDDGLNLVSLNDPGTAQTVGIIALVVILFQGGLTTMPSDLRRAALPGLVLATVGVVLTAGTVTAGVLLILRTDVITAALIGSVVASTDAAAVFAVVRKAPLPRRLMALLEVESGTNDPMAIMLTIGVLEVWRGQPTAAELAVFGVVQLGGGLVVGVLVGWAGAALIRWLQLNSASLYPVLALCVAGIAFGSATVFGASGFLAVYLAGFVLAVRAPRHRRAIRLFHEGLANAAEILLFLVLGLLVFPSQLPSVLLPALAITAVLMLVARPFAVHASLLPLRLPFREQVLVAWAGLRGAVPIVLATFPLTAGHPEGAAIFNVVFFVVLLSTTVQAATIGWAAGRLGLRRGGRVWTPIAEAVSLPGIDADLVEVEIHEDLHVAGRTLREVPLPRGMLVTAIVRGAGTIVPSGGTRLESGDIVLVTAPRDAQPGEDLARGLIDWARGEGQDPLERMPAGG